MSPHFEFGHMLAGFCHAMRTVAPASADPAVTDLLNEILKGQAAMAIDLSKLQADQTKAIAMLQALPALKAQVADLQAKLAAAPHDDPTVQATVDQMAQALEAAMPADPATDTTAAATAAAPTTAAPEQPAPTPPVDTTAQSAPSAAPAAPDTPAA